MSTLIINKVLYCDFFNFDNDIFINSVIINHIIIQPYRVWIQSLNRGFYIPLNVNSIFRIFKSKACSKNSQISAITRFLSSVFRSLLLTVSHYLILFFPKIFELLHLLILYSFFGPIFSLFIILIGHYSLYSLTLSLRLK